MVACIPIVVGIVAILGVTLIGGGIYAGVRESTAPAAVLDLVTVCPSDQAGNTDGWTSFIDDVESVNEGAKFTLFHMFHISNHEEVAQGLPSKLREVGPYAFREYTVRSHTSFGTDGPNNESSVKTIEEYTSTFDAVESARLGCTGPGGEPCDFENDDVTSFNPILLGGAALTGTDKLLPIALTPKMLDISAELLSDGRDMCDFLFEHQDAGTLGLVVDELETKEFWKNAGWSEEQQAAAVTTLKGSAEAGFGLGTNNAWLLQERPSGKDKDFYSSSSPAHASFGGDAPSGEAYGHLMQSQCTCRMIKAQAADPTPMLTFLSAALAAVTAGADFEADPTNEDKEAVYAAAAAEALVQQGNVFSELTKMIVKDGDTKESNTCGGYSNIFTPFVMTHSQNQAVDPNTPICEQLVSVACITTVGGIEYKKVSAEAKNTINAPAWVASCDALVDTDDFPAECYSHAGAYGDGSPFLTQLGPLMYIVTADYIGTMLFYFQKLSALGNALTLAPGLVPDGSGVANDGAMISRTMQEWSHGYTSGMSMLTGPWTGYIAVDHETGTPLKQPRQYLTGCDDVKHVNVRDKRGDSCTQSDPSADLTEEEADACFAGLYTHYAEFTAQGYDPIGDGLGMRISGYDGASAPSVSLTAWREKLAGKTEHLRDKLLPVYVSQAYQDLNLVRSDSSFMVNGKIEATQYTLSATALASNENNSKTFIGLQFDVNGLAANVDGLMDRKKLDGVYPHVALSQPYFVNGAASLVANILTWDPETSTYKQLESSTTEKHPEYETWVAMEQLSGVTIAAHKRLQANFIIDSGLLAFTCATCSVAEPFPIYWIDETGALTAEQSDSLSSFLGLARRLPLFMAVLLGVGIGLLVFGIGLQCMRGSDKDEVVG